VYAVNTAGAFLGALAAGFFLVPTLGLVMVMRAMGAVNLLAGAIFGCLGVLRGRGAAPAEAPPPGSEAAPRIEGFRSYAAAALLIGFAMMALQTVIIRIGGLSLGASQFTFSMVVAVFVLCIALGSVTVSAARRIPAFVLPVNLWALVAALLLLYLLLPLFPYGAHVLRTTFSSVDPAFYLYHLVVFLALLLVVGPAVVLSGASLPLLFHQLRRQVGDLGAVAGSLYSWNTAGSLFGALLGGYLLLFWLDLDQVYRVAVLAAIGAAALVTLRLGSGFRPTAALVTTLALALALGFGSWPREFLMNGLFRYRTPLPLTYAGAGAFFADANPDLLFYEDGPTSSIAVVQQESQGVVSRSIINNGKPDGDTVGDYETMALAAIIPALLSERARRAFVIGFGTGITVGELAALPDMAEVVVSEISPAVMRAAPLFDPANLAVSKSDKVRVVRSDAYRALLRSEGGYDLVVSEPSNPWMTGVEMLYSSEFLAAARARLAPGGVYAQWFHLYETDSATVELVLRTFAEVFDRVSVWYGEAYDLIILGFQDGSRPLDLERLQRRARTPAYAAALARCGVDSLPELLGREIVPLGALHAAELGGPVHTLLRPILGYRAARAFYRGESGRVPFTGFGAAAVVGASNSLMRRVLSTKPSQQAFDGACGGRVAECVSLLAKWSSAAEDPASVAPWVQAASQISLLGGSVDSSLVAEVALLHRAPPFGQNNRAIRLEIARRASRNYVQYYSHATPFAPGALIDLWSRCQAPAGPADACRHGSSQAQQLLRSGVPGE
jgi:spermidine synthase